MFPPNNIKITPEGGWVENSWYLVEVAFNRYNPVHKALLYTGFLCPKTGYPSGYNCLIAINNSYEDTVKFSEPYYLKPLNLIIEKGELRNDNLY